MLKAVIILVFSTVTSFADSADPYGCMVKDNLHYCTAVNENVAKMQCSNLQCVGAIDPSTKPGVLEIYQPASDGFIYIPRPLLSRDRGKLLKSLREFP